MTGLKVPKRIPAKCRGEVKKLLCDMKGERQRLASTGASRKRMDELDDAIRKLSRSLKNN